mgnify:CR=1 FL=1
MPKQDTFETEQLTDAAFYILLALIEPLHGYAIMKAIEQMTGIQGIMGPGTLYTLLKKMCANELISQTVLPDGKKRYALTDKGRTLLRHELHRRETIVAIARKVMREKGI